MTQCRLSERPLSGAAHPLLQIHVRGQPLPRSAQTDAGRRRRTQAPPRPPVFWAGRSRGVAKHHHHSLFSSPLTEVLHMAALTHPGCRGPFQHPMDAAVLPPAILAPPPASWAHHQLSSTTLDAFQGPKPVPGRALRRNSVFGSIAMVRSASTPTPPSSTSPTVPESPPRRQGSLHHLRRHSGISLLLAAHSSTTRSPDSRAGSWHANGAQQSLNPMPSSHHIDQVPKRISFSGPQSWKSKVCLAR